MSIFDATTIKNAGRDARRKQDTACGMVAKPEQTIRKNKGFAQLREERWTEELACLMARFARSKDPSVDIWPYGKFADKMVELGVEWPAAWSMSDMVEHVERFLQQASEKWYKANIELPMTGRMGSTLLGLGWFEITDQSSSKRVGETGPSDNSGTWMKGRVNDSIPRNLVELHCSALFAESQIRKNPQVLDKALGRIDHLNQQAVLHREVVLEVTLAVLQKQASPIDYREFEDFLREQDAVFSCNYGHPQLIIDTFHEVAPEVAQEPNNQAIINDVATVVRWLLMG